MVKNAMPFAEPTPPHDLSNDLAEALEECSLEEVRAADQYAEALVEYRELEAEDEDEDEEETGKGRPDEMPDDVPTKATLTVKQINNNRYYYWQWREGEKIRSQYKGPVNPDE